MNKLKVMRLFTEKFEYYSELTLESLLDEGIPSFPTFLPDGEYILRTNQKGRRVNFYVIKGLLYVLSNEVRNVDYHFDYYNNNLIPYFRLCEYNELLKLKHLLSKETLHKLKLFEFWLERRQTQREIYYMVNKL